MTDQYRSDMIEVPCPDNIEECAVLHLAHKPKPAPAVDVSEQDIERWMREMPNTLLDRLPDSTVRKEARAHLHEAARLAHAIRIAHGG